MTAMLLPPAIELGDPHPIAAEAPYTFFMPHPEQLAALQAGDSVKLVFRQTEGDPEYSAERMWVGIESIADGWITGTLDNEPSGMDRIKLIDREEGCAFQWDAESQTYIELD